MKKLSECSIYYIPTYIMHQYRGNSYERSILYITKQYLSQTYNIAQTKKINDADFILSDKPLSLTSKDVLTPMDIFELLELESRNTKWSIQELQELDIMLNSADQDTCYLARDIIIGLHPNILREAINRGYIINFNKPTIMAVSEPNNYFLKLAFYYIANLANQYRKNFI